MIFLGAALVWVLPLLLLLRRRQRSPNTSPQSAPTAQASPFATDYSLLVVALCYWILIQMIPPMVLSFLVPITDRYLFLPSVGVCLLLAFLFTSAGQALPRARWIIWASLAALAHPQRLRIFRRLVREGTNGLPAYAIAEAVDASPTATSFHLKELDRAGLIRSTRDGRYVRYAIHVEGMRQLLTYLTEDCCQGQPELCGATIKNARTLCKSKGGSR